MMRLHLSHLAPGSTFVRFTAHPSIIARARHWAAEQARAQGAALRTVRTVELLTTEAVTNAVVHGPAAGTIEVSVEQVGDAVRIGVRDDGDARPVLRDPAPTDLSGRGVLLIDRLSQAWGVQRHRAGGKTVWFEIADVDDDTAEAPSRGR